MSARAEIATKLDEVQELCRRHKVARLFVYGSALREDFDPQRSDMDFGVEFLPETWQPWMGEFYELAQALEQVFQRRIDLGPLGAFKSELIAQRVRGEQEQLYVA